MSSDGSLLVESNVLINKTEVSGGDVRTDNLTITRGNGCSNGLQSTNEIQVKAENVTLENVCSNIQEGGKRPLFVRSSADGTVISGGEYGMFDFQKTVIIDGNTTIKNGTLIQNSRSSNLAEGIDFSGGRLTLDGVTFDLDDDSTPIYRTGRPSSVNVINITIITGKDPRSN